MAKARFEAPRGQVVEFNVDSQVLRGNLLGDPTTRRVAVYLPETYDPSRKTYPLFVDLVGYTGSGLSHVGWKAFAESVPQRIDRLIAQEKMGDVVVAFPDCFTSLGGNQYINSIAMGRWADFLIDELVPALEENFALRRGREHRALFGKSSGGYGSIVHGLRYADTWAAVASHSGDMGFDWVYRTDFPKVVTALERHAGIENFLAHVAQGDTVRGDDFHVLMTLAMAATYDPDPTAFKGIRLPVDLRTCELDEACWRRWLSHDPIHLLDDPAHQENLRRLSGIYLDCGSRDQYAIHFGNRRFASKLRELNIPAHYDEFDGTHSGTDHRMDESLPFLYRSIAGDAE
jgi:enterochelin esterase-like enzyme